MLDWLVLKRIGLGINFDDIYVQLTELEHFHEKEISYKREHLNGMKLRELQRRGKNQIRHAKAHRRRTAP